MYYNDLIYICYRILLLFTGRNRDFILLIHCFLKEDYLIISEMQFVEFTLTAVTAVTAKVTAVNITIIQNKVLGGRQT
jgi:hypothetical protein